MGPITSFDGAYGFLSNFYPCDVTMPDGITYPSVEHAFQAQKTEDVAARRGFLDLTAGQAKRRGRLVHLRPDWDDVKDDVMLTALRLKFADPDLRAKLLITGDAELVEGNTWGDMYWGVCSGHGRNRLGQLLMQVRNEIRAGKADT